MEHGETTSTRVALGALIYVVDVLLLTSIGGLGIVASPVMLPLVYVAMRLNPTNGFRIAGIIIGGLTGAEAGWGVAYVVLGYDSAAMLLVGAVTGLAAAIALSLVGRRAHPAASV